jgi:hypothetical protein
MPASRTKAGTEVGPAAEAGAAIAAFIQGLADRGLAASTRRIRRHFLNEALTHARGQGDQEGAGTLTAAQMMTPDRANAWLADAAEGKTRTRNTLRGPDAAAYPNSMRARAVTWNAFAEFLGLPDRVDPEPPAEGFRLSPADTERLLHDLTVRRPVHANAVTALRTAAMAALVSDTNRNVPELAELKVSALHLDGKEPAVDLGENESCKLSNATVHILSRWLSARATFIAELEGTDPGHLWIPTKPGRPRDGILPPKPGLTPAAVRTLHHAHRTLVSQMIGTPLRPGALRDLLPELEAEAYASPDKAAPKAGQAGKAPKAPKAPKTGKARQDGQPR